ncbi:MAG: hypothetical protein IJO96_04775 [Oscillospiraceae bacterium]|nr:hypothetical protein [Oscillospiraceae bacterium]
MGLRKCPRCELNYIRDDEQVCNVCKRHMKGEVEADELITICSECGENPAVRGSELCAICLREVRRQENLEKLVDEMAENAVDDMHELDMPLDDEENDIPEMELEEIDKELGGDMDSDEDLVQDEEEFDEWGNP